MADRQIETLPGAPAMPSVDAAANQPPAPSVPVPAEPAVAVEEVAVEEEVTPRETGVAAVASEIADRASQAAHYVQEHYVRETVTGLGRIIRRYPAPSLAGAAVAGFIVGRALRSR